MAAMQQAAVTLLALRLQAWSLCLDQSHMATSFAQNAQNSAQKLWRSPRSKTQLMHCLSC
jgi:hypothetical protein